MSIAGSKDRATRARAHDQRERILDAARRIILCEGHAALSMRKIADAIGYSPASLYLHFDGRDAIAEALGREGYAQLLAHLEPHARAADARERLHALAHAYVAFGCDHPQTYELIFMPRGRLHQMGPHARRRRDACGMQLFAATLSELTLARGAHADCGLLAEVLWATLHGVVMLTLAGAEFAPAAPGPLIEAALDAWFGERAGPGAPGPVQTSGAAS